MKKLLIIDIDGVIIDFRAIDHSIIKELYGNNKIVLLLDAILWFINGMDIITNTFEIFRLRLKLYSFLNGSNYSSDMKKYRNRYLQMSEKYFWGFLNNEYKKLKDEAFEILILSCDLFDAFLFNEVKVVKNKRDYVNRYIYKNYKEIYVVGNNYMDDIKSGLKLRRKCVVPVHIFYVGHGRILKILSKLKGFGQIQSIKELFKTILFNEK